jgi:glycosyltransferase involved in cell wall biosynthesis
MHILRIHNRYLQRGGEDVSFESEVRLLRSAGHTVTTLEFNNTDIPEHASNVERLRLATTTVWSRQAQDRLATAIEAQRPNVAHFDNTFPLVSPSAYTTCRQHNVAVIQTLHNYRLLCPSATFYRDGRPCEDCLRKTPPWPGVMHACYRSSRAQTAVVVAMLTAHRSRRTWSRDIDRFIAPTEFVRSKFLEGGVPPERIIVKPNFVDVAPSPRRSDEGAFLFVGRLAPEKGIVTLVQAVRMLPSYVPVRIAGDGPLNGVVEVASTTVPNVFPLGALDHGSVFDELRRARALIMPSEWYETFGLTIIEAFAAGTPVIASRLGAMMELIDDGRTGLLFEAGNADDLAAKVRWAADHPAEMVLMGQNARQEYEAKYTPERNYDLLMAIYRDAIAHAASRNA